MPPTIFQLLEDEGFPVSEDLKYFLKYLLKYYFECIVNPKPGLENSKKFTWNAKHIPLSVSVCSSIPEYDQPKCFVSDRDSKQHVRAMIDYLEKISQKGYGLLKEEFSFLFEAIDQKLEEMKSRHEIGEPNTVSNTNVNTQEDGKDEVNISSKQMKRKTENLKIENENNAVTRVCR